MKVGPGESSESPRMAGEVVEGVDLSRWRKRKGKEEMAVTGTVVTSERRKGGNDSLQG